MGSVQARTAGSASKGRKGEAVAEAVRSLIAQYLRLDVTRVTDTSQLSHDLGADWLDRLELFIRLRTLPALKLRIMKRIGSSVLVI